MDKNIQLVAACIITLLLCFSMNVAFYSKFSARFDSIDKKLIEIDGRRNAQYGIMKRAIEQQCKVDNG